MMLRIAKLAVPLAVLALLMWWADAEAVIQRLQGADLVWLGIAVVTLTALTLLMAKRWQIVTVALNMELPFGRAIREYYISQLVNLVLPGGVAGDVGRAIRTRHEGDLVRAAQSVAAERFLGQIALFVVMGVAFAFAMLVPGGIDWPSFIWLGIAALFGAAAVFVVLARTHTATGRFLRVVADLMSNAGLILNAVVITALLVFSLYACARATGTVIPLNAVFTLIPLILSTMLIPLSVGGWGWREGAAAALFPIIGASPSAGIAMGIAYGAMMTIAALPALVFLAGPLESKSLTQNTNRGSTWHI
ncbi:MAG: lysylphosphatidylglycerol synthase transmembrane domain-containing protein [Pseudomonadota bacterium]